jgi:hypothetical protein
MWQKEDYKSLSIIFRISINIVLIGYSLIALIINMLFFMIYCILAIFLISMSNTKDVKQIFDRAYSKETREETYNALNIFNWGKK